MFTFVLPIKEVWQSERMRRTRNPVYVFWRIGGLNPSTSAFYLIGSVGSSYFV